MMIDTHCHLNSKIFKSNIENVIKKAKLAEVSKIIIPGINLKSSQKAINLANKYNQIYAAVGIHPHWISESRFKQNLEKRDKLNLWNINIIEKKLQKLTLNKKVVAVGECGLDYYHINNTKTQYPKSLFKKIQKKLFKTHVKIAIKTNLPLIIHNRQASCDTLNILAKAPKTKSLRGVFHCFEGNQSLIDFVFENNFYIGASGMVTRNKKTQEIVNKTPLNKLLLETDSPFQSPEPLRSQKVFPNTPENVKIIAEEIAQIKGDSFFNIVKQTTKNAKNLFKL